MNISNFIKLTPKQLQAFKYVGKGYRVFVGGARGGGKTEICRAAAILAALQFPGIRVVCIRETYSELEINFIIPMLEKYPPEVFGYKYKERSKMLVFENGSIIYFRSCANEKDTQKIQGMEFQLMIIDEACNIDEYVIQKLSGSLRNATISNFKATMLMTGNPGGVSDNYFLTRFVEPDYQQWTEGELKNRQYYVFIPMKVADNPHMSQEYKDWLQTLPEDLREAWLHGNWRSFFGSFFKEFNPKIHTVKPFEIPDDWVRKGGFDIGFKNHPAAAVWVAQNPSDQTLYVYREYVDTGVTEDYIKNIVRLSGNERIVAWYVDPSMFYLRDKNKITDESSAMMFARAGIPVIPANNNRVEGWRVLKQWLHYTDTRSPKLYIFENCYNVISCIQSLRYATGKVKKEDADTRQFDDPADALRYVVVSGFIYPTEDIVMEVENINSPTKSIDYQTIMQRFTGFDFDDTKYPTNNNKEIYSFLEDYYE